MRIRALPKRLILLAALLCISMLPVGAVLGQSSARIGVFEPLTLAPDAIVEIPIRVENITDLYAIDFEMRFDPAILQAQDADPASAGIQMGFGEFLEPGLLLFNTVDNDQGIVRFVMTQVNPTEPKSGSGILFVLYMKGVKEGDVSLTITNLQTADRQGQEILSTKVENTVTVAANAPQTSATSIPVVNPTAMIIIPTMAPTAIPTATLVPTAAPIQPTQQPVVSTPKTADAQPTAAVTSAASETPAQGFSLVKNWWIVALVAVIAIGLGIVLFKTKPPL